LTEKPNKDRKQVPLRVFEPPPEDPLPEEDPYLAIASKRKEPNPHLFNEENTNINAVETPPTIIISSGEGNPPSLPSSRERNERKKERILTFVVSNVLYGVPLPVEIDLGLIGFSQRAPRELIDIWSELAVKTEQSPRRNGKLQRALWKSMVLYIVDAKHRKPDQQLTLKTQPTSYNPVYRVCPATLGEINAAKCASCTHAYGCNFYTYKTKGGP
jgi:hypothetical protein